MYNVMRNELKQDAKERIIEALENGYDGYLCDLHNEVFNTDYEYTYTSDAKEMLELYDVFEAIGEVQNYEQSNFGFVNTDLSSPCDVANMIWYIVGEEALNELMGADEEYSDFMIDLWNSRIEDEDRTTLIDIFKEGMQEV